MNKDILKGKKYSEFQYFITKAYHFLATCSSFLYHFTLNKEYNCKIYIENMIHNKLITCLDIYGSQVLNNNPHISYSPVPAYLWHFFG